MNRKKNGKIKLGRNATPELKKLIRSINSSGSKTAADQIMKTGSNETKVHVKIEKGVHDKPGQTGFNKFGMHQAHDKEGNPLTFDSKKGDFDGVPAYIEGKEGVYKEATITVFTGNIKKYGGNGRSFYGYNITENQEVANTFQHEANHNTDKEFIQDLRNKREGRPYKGIGAHDNISPQEGKVFGEMQKHNQ